MFHSAVLAYVRRADRERFAAAMQARDDVVWISNEALTVVPGVETDAQPPEGVAPGYFVVGRGGTTAVALADPHGTWLSWLP